MSSSHKIQTNSMPPEHLMMMMTTKSMMTMMTMTSMMMMMTGRRREAVVSAVIWKLSLTPKYQGMPAQGASVIHSHHSQIQIYKYNTNTQQNKDKYEYHSRRGCFRHCHFLIFIIITSKLAKNPLFSCAMLVFLSDVLSVNLSNCEYSFFLLRNAHGCGLTAQNILS